MTDPEKKIPDFFKYTNMGIQMMVVIAAGVYGGIKLDEYFMTESQVYTITLSLFAVFAAIYLAIKDFISFK